MERMRGSIDQQKKRECEASEKKEKSEPRETKAKSYHYFDSPSTSRLPYFFLL